MDHADFAVLAAVTLAGALVQSAFGFGFAILVAPLFLVVMDSSGAIPVLAVLNLLVSALVAARSWRRAPFRILALLCLGSVVGFPIGLFLFRHAAVSDLKTAVGVVIMGFALLLLARERGHLGQLPVGGSAAQPSASIALAMGAVSGAMASALAMPGPVAMLYISTCRLAKDEIRALSLAFFSFAYAAVSMLHGLEGNLGADRLWLAAELAAFVIVGGMAGQVVARRISEAQFRQCILLILFLAGLYAVVSA